MLSADLGLGRRPSRELVPTKPEPNRAESARRVYSNTRLSKDCCFKFNECDYSSVFRYGKPGSARHLDCANFLCPPNRQMGTGAHSQPHARITTKLFCFSGNVENRRVVLTIPPSLGAGGPEFKSRRPDQNISRVFFSLTKVLFP